MTCINAETILRQYSVRGEGAIGHVVRLFARRPRNVHCWRGNSAGSG